MRKNAQQAAMLRQRIARLTGICENEQHDAIFEQAHRWLELWTDADTYVIATVTRTSVFWGWWLNQWCIADRAFLARREHPRALPCNEAAEWRRIHDAEAMQLYPPQCITEEAFRQMKEAVIKELEQIGNVNHGA